MVIEGKVSVTFEDPEDEEELQGTGACTINRPLITMQA